MEWLATHEWVVIEGIVLALLVWEWIRIQRELKRMRRERDQGLGMRNGSSERTQAEAKRSSDSAS